MRYFVKSKITSHCLIYFIYCVLYHALILSFYKQTVIKHWYFITNINISVGIFQATSRLTEVIRNKKVSTGPILNLLYKMSLSPGF